MDNKLMAKGILLVMISLGIELENWKDSYDSTTVWISVPKASIDFSNGIEPLAGKKLADRLMTKMRDMGCKNFQVKFRIRDEVWTAEKREQAIENGKRDMYGI